MHALKILRNNGMSSDALKVIYKSVVLRKTLYRPILAVIQIQLALHSSSSKHLQLVVLTRTRIGRALVS